MYISTDGKGNASFDIILHYNGELDEWGYHSGDVVVEEFEVDRISLVTIDVWVESLGLMGEFQYYWKMAGLDFKCGLKLLENDVSVFELALNASHIHPLALRQLHIRPIQTHLHHSQVILNHT